MKMISPVSTALLLVAPLCAQAPAPSHPVRILLQMDKPPIGTPALDTVPIVEILRTFAREENLAPPPPDGDGWLVGIGLTTQEELNGMLVGGGLIRLTPVHHGKPTPEEAKESGVLTVALKSDALAKALGDQLVLKSRELLAQAKVIPQRPPTFKIPASDLVPADGQSDPHHFEFSQVTVRNQPAQPPYPSEARKNHVQGTVVVEITVGPDGTPVSAAALEGPGALLPYACSYVMHWRFNPLTMNGHPEYGRFRMTLNFRLSE